MMLSARQLLDAGPTVSIGILTADLSKLSDELSILDEAGASIVHVDVMDGVFCPTLTVGPPVVAAIPDRFVKDCHLMIDEPLEKVQAFVAAGAGIITFQVESTRHPHRVLQALAGTGVLRGVALNPGTPVATLEPLVEELEMILVLAVNPGWGGQEFLPSTERRLADVRALIADREVVVGVDGGITKENIEYVATLGADLVVSGSAIYDGGPVLENARYMLRAVRGRTSEVPA
jgi:ribulose-phosphate 3-epimerase